MLERGAGKIVFTASLLTFQGALRCRYAASKGAIGQLTKALANEWASKGGQVNAIAPGYINRRFLSRVLSAVVQFKLGRFHQRLGPQREMKLVEVRRSSAGNRKHDIG